MAEDVIFMAIANVNISFLVMVVMMLGFIVGRDEWGEGRGERDE